MWSRLPDYTFKLIKGGWILCGLEKGKEKEKLKIKRKRKIKSVGFSKTAHMCAAWNQINKCVIILSITINKNRVVFKNCSSCGSVLH